MLKKVKDFIFLKMQQNRLKLSKVLVLSLFLFLVIMK